MRNENENYVKAKSQRFVSFPKSDYREKLRIPPYTSSLEMDVTVIILKVSVPRVTEKLIENRDGVTEKLIENVDRLIEKLIEKSIENGERFTENRIAILRLIAENPYI